MGDRMDPILRELDANLRDVRAAVAKRKRLIARLEYTRRHQAQLHARVSRLTARVERERYDVDVMAGATLSGLMEELFGDLPARQEKERREWIAAQIKLDQAHTELEASRADALAIERRIATDKNPGDEYARLLKEKDQWLANHEATPKTHAIHQSEQTGLLMDVARELDEALWAGQLAGAALTGVLHALSKAQAVGRLDMVGLASSWGKFSHLDDAHRHASAANRALSRFQMELADVQVRHQADLSMAINGISTFADFFIDDLVSDWVVQCRIDRSHSSASIARTRVNRTLRFLVQRRFEIAAELRQRTAGNDLAG
jgi:hypothetical protein